MGTTLRSSMQGDRGIAGAWWAGVAAAGMLWSACALHGQEGVRPDAAAGGTQVKEPASRQEPADVSEVAKPVTTEWGQVGTLRLRATLPPKVSLAELFTGKVEFAWEKGPLPASAPKTILKRDLEFQGILHFKHVETGKEFEVGAENRWSGMPPGNSHDTTEVDVAADGQWNWDCRWRASRGGSALAPGTYDVSVEVVTWVYTASEMKRGLSVSSGSVRVEVGPVEFEERVVLVPKGEQLKDVRWVSTGDEMEEVTVRVTKGYLTGMSHSGGMRGGLPTKEHIEPYKDLYMLARFKGDRGAIRVVAPTIRITLFETCETAMHFWNPRNCGYRVLLEREYVMSPGSGK